MSVQYKLNKELAQMLKGGVIMDVTTPEQAKIAEAAGACAVMALERIPADIRAAGGVSRMSDPKMIRGIQEAVSIPVMAKCRIGHFVSSRGLIWPSCHAFTCPVRWLRYSAACARCARLMRLLRSAS